MYFCKISVHSGEKDMDRQTHTHTSHTQTSTETHTTYMYTPTHVSRLVRTRMCFHTVPHDSLRALKDTRHSTHTWTRDVPWTLSSTHCKIIICAQNVFKQNRAVWRDTFSTQAHLVLHSALSVHTSFKNCKTRSKISLLRHVLSWKKTFPRI